MVTLFLVLEERYQLHDVLLCFRMHDVQHVCRTLSKEYEIIEDRNFTAASVYSLPFQEFP